MSEKALTTCLWFDTQGEEAARFYTSVFKDSKLGRTVPYGEAGRRDADMTMLVEFELKGQKFIALNGGPQFTHSEAISFQIPCDDQDEVDYYWDALTEGGEEGPCGWLKDRFGVSWQVVPTRVIELMSDPDPERAKRAGEAVYATMGKIEIAAIEAAAEGKTAPAGG
jgi:predicted 3-demethylubiquinone-9 3-methyltransferase (glyoxalase superfamily)